MRKYTLTIMIMASLGLPALAHADTDSQQREINALKAQNKLILERLDATAEMLESSPARKAGTTGNPDMAAGNSLRDRVFGSHGNRGTTTIGGYGEMHYNNLNNRNPGGSDKKQIDFHRFVLFLGHEYSDKIRFWSELEVEHSVVQDTSNGSNGGEVAIEQAFMEFDLNSDMSARAGILLVPVGILNETHEPSTFYGVERNNVEKYIIPATWSEGGVSLTGRFADSFSYDLAVHSGLQIAASNNYAIRSGRQDVSNAPANNLAVTARVNWVGIPGLVVSAAIDQQSNATQGTDTRAGEANLFSTHIVWQISQFSLRALYARWNLSGNGPAAAGADKQDGWYVEPSWKFTPKFGVFARSSQWDNQANSNSNTQYNQFDIGFNYWPHEDVVLKFDYQNQTVPRGQNEFDGINLGIGYQF